MNKIEMGQTYKITGRYVTAEWNDIQADVEVMPMDEILWKTMAADKSSPKTMARIVRDLAEELLSVAVHMWPVSS